MKELTIQMDGDRTAFRPGEPISGQVSWSYVEAPKTIDVRLFWYTEGRGRQDVVLENEIEITEPGRQGSHAFSFDGPAEPYSFSGQLISILWAIEVVGNKGFTERLGLVIGPEGEEVRV